MIEENEEQIKVFYYMGLGKDDQINFLIKAPTYVKELVFTRDQAKFLVEQFEFYIGRDEDIGDRDDTNV